MKKVRIFDLDLHDFDRTFMWKGMTRRVRFTRTAYGDFLIWATDALSLGMNTSTPQAQNHLKEIMGRCPELCHNGKLLKNHWQVH